MREYAVSFARIQAGNGAVGRYPLLPVLLGIEGVRRHVALLVDSGSGHSFLTHSLVTRVFGIHQEDLPAGDTQQGYGGTFRTARLEGIIRFGTTRNPFEERIPFLVAKDLGIEPSFSILGREPFFER